MLRSLKNGQHSVSCVNMFNTGTDVLSVSLSKWLYIAPRGILHLVIAMCFRSLDLDGAVCLVLCFIVALGQYDAQYSIVYLRSLNRISETTFLRYSRSEKQN